MVLYFEKTNILSVTVCRPKKKSIAKTSNSRASKLNCEELEQELRRQPKEGTNKRERRKIEVWRGQARQSHINKERLFG